MLEKTADTCTQIHTYTRTLIAVVQDIKKMLLLHPLSFTSKRTDFSSLFTSPSLMGWPFRARLARQPFAPATTKKLFVPTVGFSSVDYDTLTIAWML